MGNDPDKIERIAPMPWKRPAYGDEIDDANGRLVCVCMGENEEAILVRDRIIACVNFCAGIKTKDLNAWQRSDILTKLREALLDA